MAHILNYLKIFMILLRIPKLGNLESYYDMVYTMYRHYQYNMDILPKEIRDYIESLSHRLHSVCIKSLKKSKRNLQSRIEDLKLEKESYLSYDRNSTRLNNEIEKTKQTIRSLDSLVNTTRGYSELERVLVILYNDIDTSISYSLMQNILSEIPSVEEEVNKMIRKYSIKNIWFIIKNKLFGKKNKIIKGEYNYGRIKN